MFVCERKTIVYVKWSCGGRTPDGNQCRRSSNCAEERATTPRRVRHTLKN